MLNSVQVLTNVCDANLFDAGPGPIAIRPNQKNSFYIRLFQNDEGSTIVTSGFGFFASAAVSRGGERYVPAVGATLTVGFPRAFSVGSSSSTTPAADQSFIVGGVNEFAADDRSIWRIDLTLSQSNLLAGGGFTVTLTEGPNTSVMFIPNMLTKLPSAGA